jgi:hypothetical protein
MHFTPRVSKVLMENLHVLNVEIRLLKMVKQHMEINVNGKVLSCVYQFFVCRPSWFYSTNLSTCTTLE